MSFSAPKDDLRCNLSWKNLQAISASDIPKKIEILDLSNNSIQNLRNLPRIPTLNKLICSNTMIFTFDGVVDQPRLSIVDFRNTPLTILPYYRIMASIAFGRSVDVIDDISISVNEIALRDKIGPITKRFIVEGYCIMSLDPIILYNPITKTRKRIAAGPIGVADFDADCEAREEDLYADEVLIEIASHAIQKKKKSNKKPLPKTNIEKLTYHGDNLIAYGAVKKVKGIPIPFPPYGYC